MKVSYKEDVNRKYIVGTLESEENNYELKMIESNRIPEICDCSIREVDNKKYIYYDISGKISLKDKVKNQKLTQNTMTDIFIQIGKIKEELSLFMIDMNRVMIDPQYIFIDKAGDKIQFCYGDTGRESITQKYRKLANFFIENADHEDRETVIMAYGLQQFVYSEEELDTDAIVNYIHKKGKERSESEGLAEYGSYDNEAYENLNIKYDEGVYYNNIEENLENNIGKGSVFWNKTKGDKDNKYKGNRDKGNKDKDGESNKSMLSSLFGKLFKRNEKYFTVDEMDCVISEDNNCYGHLPGEEEMEYESDKYNSDKYNSDKYNSESDILKNEEEEVIEETVLLRSSILQVGVVLKSTDMENMETIIPNTYPCIIGKSKKSADYIIDEKTISRVHMRIEQTEEGFAIEDLNSTNKTSLNGEILKPHVLTTIKIGDVISIADREYVVC